MPDWINRIYELNERNFSVAIGGYDLDLSNWGFTDSELHIPRMHEHSFFEATHVIKGKGRLHHGEEQYPLSAGSVVIVKPGESHQYESLRGEALHTYYWNFTIRKKRGKQGGSLEDELIASFLASSTPTSKGVQSLSRLFMLITEEITKKYPGFEIALQGLMLKLTLDAIRSIVNIDDGEAIMSETSLGTDEARVQGMMNFIHDNYKYSISIKDVARQVHCSDRHANRLFKKQTGIAIQQFLLNLRMEHAAGKLVSCDDPIKNIAHEVGYRNEHYFSSAFTKKMGETPKTYRNRVKVSGNSRTRSRS